MANNIPPDIQEKISEYIKGTLPAWDTPRLTDIEFGYFLAAHQLEESQKMIELLSERVVQKNVQLEEKQARIEQLEKGLKRLRTDIFESEGEINNLIDTLLNP